LWTGTHLQSTLMCIPTGGKIGLEAHPDTDQFLRVESGNGRAMMDPRHGAPYEGASGRAGRLTPL